MAEETVRYACPLCEEPCWSWTGMIAHLGSHHIKVQVWFGNSGGRCPCCKLRGSRSKIIAHFQSLTKRGKLTQHVVKAMTEKYVFGEGE